MSDPVSSRLWTVSQKGSGRLDCRTVVLAFLDFFLINSEADVSSTSIEALALAALA